MHSVEERREVEGLAGWLAGWLAGIGRRDAENEKMTVV